MTHPSNAPNLPPLSQKAAPPPSLNGRLSHMGDGFSKPRTNFLPAAPGIAFEPFS